MPREPKKWKWKCVRIAQHARLRCKRDNGPIEKTFIVHRWVDEVVARKVKGGWAVPLDNKEWLAEEKDVFLVSHFSTFTIDQANDRNTILFTCRDCGEWLKAGDSGYGTEHGWCGCEEKE